MTITQVSVISQMDRRQPVTGARLVRNTVGVAADLAKDLQQLPAGELTGLYATEVILLSATLRPAIRALIRLRRRLDAQHGEPLAMQSNVISLHRDQFT
jgi:hypothetical protein